MLTGIVVLTVALPLAVASAGPVGGEARSSPSARTSASARSSDDAVRASGRGGSSADRDSDGRASDRQASAGRAADGQGSEGQASDGRGADGRGSGGRGDNGRVSDEASVSGRADGTASESSESRPDGPKGPLTLGVGLATAARCGPELVSPDGIEAQTCVLTQGRETWARTYYRNATGGDLASVLTLLAPGGHTVRMHCAVGADDEPEVCETPRQRTVGDASVYAAVAEFAKGAEGPLLLRSGSNSPAQPAR